MRSKPDIVRTSSDTQGSTTIEAGSSSTTDYGYTETGGQTTSETGSTDSLTGDSTLTDSIDTNSSLHETGSEGASDSYVMNKTLAKKEQDLERFSLVHQASEATLH